MTTWAYLIVCGAGLSRNDLQDFLNEQTEVTYWYSCLPNCVFLTSTLSASALGDRVHERFPEPRFLIVEVHNDRQGWLPEAAWHLFQNPASPRLDNKK